MIGLILASYSLGRMANEEKRTKHYLDDLAYLSASDLRRLLEKIIEQNEDILKLNTPGIRIIPFNQIVNEQDQERDSIGETSCAHTEEPCNELKNEEK